MLRSVPGFRTAHGAGVVFGGFYAGKYVLLGVQLPFLSGFLASLGFTAAEIGLITGGALVGRLVLGPFVAHWADRQRDPRTGLRALAVLFAVGAVGLWLGEGKAAVAAATALVVWSFGLLTPLGDAALVAADRAGALRYGRIRAVGSGAFLVTTLAAGAAFTGAGLAAAPAVMAVAGVSACLFAFALPMTAPDPTAGRTPAGRGVAWRLFSSPAFLLVLAAGGFSQAGHAVYYSFSILHWSDLGYSPALVGALWATGVAAEIVFLAAAPSLARRFPPAMMLAAAGAGGIARWTMTAAEPPLAVLFAAQTLHALTFAAAYIGVIEHVARTVPARLSRTAMTLVSTSSVGALTGVATLFGGYVYTASGPGFAYLAMAALGAATLLAAAALARATPRVAGDADVAGAEGCAPEPNALDTRERRR